MEVEITDLPELTRQQAALLDLHSVVNILNVLVNELEYLQEVLGEDGDLQAALDSIRQAHEGLRTSEGASVDLGPVLGCEASVMERVRAALAAHPDGAGDPNVRDSVGNLESVFSVLDTRARELLDRFGSPGRWKDHDVAQLTENFTNVLAAIEKNSKGRYRIVYNIAEQEPQDYMVNFGIESAGGSIINMPPVLQDVMRDLIANARKYTEPGGEITAGLVDNGKELRFVVEDTGRGIPPDEIQQVVQFGRRGSNVADKETMGGGFGLTKALVVTRQFGGRMWVASRPGGGTRITLVLPRPNP
jgi:signal transduction histidine kinase